MSQNLLKFGSGVLQPWAKKLKDNQANGGETEIGDLFLASAGCEAIMINSVMVYPKQLKNLIFVEMSEIIKRS